MLTDCPPVWVVKASLWISFGSLLLREKAAMDVPMASLNPSGGPRNKNKSKAVQRLPHARGNVLAPKRLWSKHVFYIKPAAITIPNGCRMLSLSLLCAVWSPSASPLVPGGSGPPVGTPRVPFTVLETSSSSTWPPEATSQRHNALTN